MCGILSVRSLNNRGTPALHQTLRSNQSHGPETRSDEADERQVTIETRLRQSDSDIRLTELALDDVKLSDLTITEEGLLINVIAKGKLAAELIRLD